MPDATVYVMEEANLYCGAVPTDQSASLHLELSEMKMPAFNQQFVDHRAGGAPTAIEIPTIFAKLESTFQLLGWNTQVAGLIGAWSSQQNQFFAYGNIRDEASGISYQAIAAMKGKLGTADPQNWTRGALAHWNYAVKGIIHYELYIAGNQLYYWDFFENRFIVNGVDQNADINTNLNIPTFTPTPLISVTAPVAPGS